MRRILYTAVSRKVVQQKRTRQCRKVLRVLNFLVLDWGFRFFSVIVRNSTNKCIYAFSFLVGEHPWTSINERHTRSTHNTNRDCRVRFYAFVGQPLSKQLYECQRIFKTVFARGPLVTPSTRIHSSWLVYSRCLLPVDAKGCSSVNSTMETSELKVR